MVKKLFFCAWFLVVQAVQEPWAGFYKKSVDERLQLVQKHAGLAPEQISLLKRLLVWREFLEKLSENVIGAYTLPFSVATNFVINRKEYLVPMVTEEKTVVAAASYGAKLARSTGGFTASVMSPIALGQIVLTHVPDIDHAQKIIREHDQQLTAQAQQLLAAMCARGGGLVAIQAHKIETARGDMLVVELQVNTCDAMGANIVTRVAEQLASELARLTGGTVLMAIVNNRAVQRIARARAVWPRAVLGDTCVERILDAHACAGADMGRGVTHNKGIMNGIDAVALATGNDFRALEAGAHGYAARGSIYQPLTRYYTNEQGDLVGEIELPLAVGTVGGATTRNPMAQLALQIMHVQSSDELACVMASVGLAQNFAALRALVQEGIAHAFS